MNAFVLLAATAVFVAAELVNSAQPTTQIRGSVLDEDEGALAYARVRLETAPDKTTQSTTTDREGRYSFESVPAGRYTLKADKAGYLPVAWTPGRPPQTFVVSSGSVVHADIRLSRGATITGRVHGAFGQPIQRATVRVLDCVSEREHCHQLTGSGRVVQSGSAGEFRLFGLPPGDLVVVAHARVSGDSSPVHETPTELVQWAQRNLSDGAAGASRPMPKIAEPGTLAWLPTYYPSALQPDEAIRIKAQGGESLVGIDIKLRSGSSSRVTGLVSSASGRLPSSLSLFPAGAMLAVPGPTTVFVTPSGNFVTAALEPGAYRLLGRGTISDETGMTEVTETLLQLSGSDLTDIRVHLQAAADLVVVVSLDGTPFEDLKQKPAVGLRLIRKDISTVISTFDVANGKIDAVGQVRLRGLLPGAYDVAAVVDGPTIWAKSLLSSDGRDVLDEGVLLTSSATDTTTPLRLELSSRPSVVQGTLLDGEGRAAPEYLVVAFPLESSLRQHSRRVTSAVVAQDGGFVIRGLPDGDYVLGVLGTSDPASLTPALLNAIADVGQRISVSWGREVRQDIRFQRR